MQNDFAIDPSTRLPADSLRSSARRFDDRSDGDGPERAQSGRARINRAMIVDAVIAISRAEPGAQVTFKQVGDRLGVDPTALYRHFKSRDEVMSAGLDYLNGIAVQQAKASTGSWRKQLEHYAVSVVRLYSQHPSIGELGTVLDPLGSGDHEASDFMLAKFEEAGLREEVLVDAFAGLSLLMVSFGTAMATQSLAAGVDMAEAKYPWIHSFGAGSLAQFPHLNRYKDLLLGVENMRAFHAGLTRMLDSIEQQGSSRRSSNLPNLKA